ncbi:MAG TPA: hypothetical protein VNM40_03720 [Candidatus Paceibacterota bacterium]|nr:hypothetical protein [Candidatus Paceibacterota bacterium]
MLPYRDSKLVRISLLVFFAFLIAYALYEGWGMLYGPSIRIPDESILSREPYVLVKGRAERITELRLNGKTIPVTEDGDFAEPHLLAPGTNHLILEARDARGRTTQKELDVLYMPLETPSATTTAEEP